MRPTPYQSAILLIAMCRRVGGKRGAGSRWRITDTTLRRLSFRTKLREAFIDELEDELAQLGYCLLRLPTGGFGLIEASTFESWPRVSTRARLDAELRALKTGDAKEFGRLVEAAEAEFAPDQLDEDDDE